MHRCLQLASLGAGNVAPNPMVGAVLVNNDRIIGEGYHQKYGGPHAEPNCLTSVKEEDMLLIAESVLYVSLEPCAHFGKTPPCTDLIIQNKIPKVVVGCRDPFNEVNGKGIEKLSGAGIEVQQHILEEKCKELNKRFFTFHTAHRPYIILKWAQTANGQMAEHSLSSSTGENSTQSSPVDNLQVNRSWSRDEASELIASTVGGSRDKGDRLHISNEFTNRLVHKWRSEDAAILIGTNTALMDDPQLTTRLWPGNNPVRLVVDMDLKLSASSKVFNPEANTIVFNKLKHGLENNVAFYQVTGDVSIVHQISNALYQSKIQSVIVEGGARLLQSFIDEDLWDEARVITNRRLAIRNGLAAPDLHNCEKTSEQNIFSDFIEFYNHAQS